MKKLTLITAIALLIALLPLPYFYFQLLRWLVCITALYLINSHNLFKEQPQVTILIIIIVVFNPIAPIHFPTVVWKILDVITGIYFFLTSKKSNL